jgi:hypothetical protein
MYGQVDDRLFGAIAVSVILLVVLAAGVWAMNKAERAQRDRNGKLPKRPPFRRGYDD